METLKRFRSVDEALDYCISKEEASAELYKALAGLMKNPEMVQLFRDLARMEEGHRKKLEEMKVGKTLLCVGAKMPDIGLRQDLPRLNPDSDMDSKQALILAIKKEVIAFTFYTCLAEACADENIRNILMALGEEEAHHKLRLEREYEMSFEHGMTHVNF